MVTDTLRGQFGYFCPCEVDSVISVLQFRGNHPIKREYLSRLTCNKWGINFENEAVIHN